MENIKVILETLTQEFLYLKQYSDDAESLEQLQNEVNSVFENTLRICEPTEGGE